MSEHDTVVIGGGQAGLAMSYHLSSRNRDHVVLERGRIAERWHGERWDSLRFQFPNWTMALPGMAYDGPEPDVFAHYRDVAKFIESYARHIEAPVRPGVEVIRLQRTASGRFQIETSAGDLTSRHVVVATGPFQRPLVPGISSRLPARIAQIHAADYRNPETLPSGAVLVVGSGASGCQIAEELLSAGRTVYLSISRHRRVPRRYRGRDLFWWLTELGRFDVTIDSFPDRRPLPTALITGVNGGYDVDLRRFAANGGHVLGYLRGTDGEQLHFNGNAEQLLSEADSTYSDFVLAAENHVAARGLDLPPAEPPSSRHTRHIGSIEPVLNLDAAASGIKTVIWATGYEYDYRWIDMDLFDAQGAPKQQRGVTDCPGLYFLGLHWMHTLKSGLFFGVGEDAAFIAEHISARSSG
ncbi:NAD(P)-binding domain-containing protein [Rhizobium sp. TH2]|nr:NAD(P)-binding domain-containing protein [Rhizobium sp. TH2]UVC11589.1 NAD(P)-binding domain-containing protein [Rhizobium sp. TH2]